MAEGLDGLEERSRAPHRHPDAVAPEVEAAILAMRGQHRKVRAWLLAHRSSPAWPAASMIGTIFARHGLVVRRRRRVAPPNGPLTAAGTANAVWSVDFKGRFRTGDGARCDPLTLLDVHCKIARNFDPTP